MVMHLPSDLNDKNEVIQYLVTLATAIATGDYAIQNIQFSEFDLVLHFARVSKVVKILPYKQTTDSSIPLIIDSL